MEDTDYIPSPNSSNSATQYTNDTIFDTIPENPDDKTKDPDYVPNMQHSESDDDYLPTHSKHVNSSLSKFKVRPSDDCLTQKEFSEGNLVKPLSFSYTDSYVIPDIESIIIKSLKELEYPDFHIDTLRSIIISNIPHFKNTLIDRKEIFKIYIDNVIMRMEENNKIFRYNQIYLFHSEYQMKETSRKIIEEQKKKDENRKKMIYQKRVVKKRKSKRQKKADDSTDSDSSSTLSDSSNAEESDDNIILINDHKKKETRKGKKTRKRKKRSSSYGCIKPKKKRRKNKPNKGQNEVNDRTTSDSSNPEESDDADKIIITDNHERKKTRKRKKRSSDNNHNIKPKKRRKVRENKPNKRQPVPVLAASIIQSERPKRKIKRVNDYSQFSQYGSNIENIEMINEIDK